MNGRTIQELASDKRRLSVRPLLSMTCMPLPVSPATSNPAHIDSVYAESTVFKARIAHGALTAGLLSAVFAMQLPGPGAIYVSMNLNFLKPVYFNDTITAEVEVVNMDVEKNRVLFRTSCKNQKQRTRCRRAICINATKGKSSCTVTHKSIHHTIQQQGGT